MDFLQERFYLTTPNRHLLPRICFRDDIDYAWDRKAQIYLGMREEKVWMYEGNATYPQKQFNLFQHNLGLIDLALSHYTIRNAVYNFENITAQQQYFIKTLLQGILLHDGGERAGEEMTFSLKCEHPELVPHAKKMEKVVGPAIYTMALCAVANKDTNPFFYQTQKIQTRFESKLLQMEGTLFTEDYYKTAVEAAICAIEKAEYSALKYLSKKDRRKVDKMSAQYDHEYNAVENPDSPYHGPAHRLTKVIDKNCPSYTDHAKACYLQLNNTTPLHDQFDNLRTINDIKRSEKSLISYIKAMQDDEIALYFSTAAKDITCTHMIDYALTMRPVINSDQHTPLPETSLYASRNDWLQQIYLPQMTLVAENRQNGKHFLEDDLKTNLEIAAIFETKKILGENLDNSIFDTKAKYSSNFARTAEHLLNSLQKQSPVKRLPVYEYPTLNFGK